MHAPMGHALMGWVPYPPHMGPHFVGPITALRAFKKKKKYPSVIMAKTCANQVVNVRIDVSPATLQKVKVWPKLILQNVKLRLFCEGKYTDLRKISA